MPQLRLNRFPSKGGSPVPPFALLEIAAAPRSLQEQIRPSFSSCGLELQVHSIGSRQRPPQARERRREVGRDPRPRRGDARDRITLLRAVGLLPCSLRAALDESDLRAIGERLTAVFDEHTDAISDELLDAMLAALEEPKIVPDAAAQ